MKLFVQADDYGMTTGVTDGIVACGRDGILTQTGLFTNMPSAEYAVRRWRQEMPHVLLGQDLNLSTGRPVTDPKLIPSLVNEDGSFLTSRQHRVKEAETPDHVRYEDAYLEYDNQVKRFIELTGEKPGYIGPHAWFNKTTNRAMNDIIEKDGCRSSTKLINPSDSSFLRIGGWSKPVIREDKSYDYSVNTQLAQDPLEYWNSGLKEEIIRHAPEDVLCMLHTHAGFLDRDLYRLSSFSAVRPMEAGFLCSEEMRSFVRDYNIELVNYSYFD